MKKLIFILLLFSFVFTLQAQDPYMRWQRIGYVSFNGTGTDSILIKGYTPSEINNNEVRWRGAWGLNAYPQLLSGTYGTAKIYYRIADWTEKIAENDSTNMVASWTITDKFYYFDIHQTAPVYALWIYVERLTGTGTLRIHFYDTKIKYE